MMKTNKVTKLGVSLLSVAALGVVAPALTDVPVFGSTVVKAEERGPLEYTIAYYDKDTGEEIAPRKTGTINPGETVNIYKDIDGYQVVSNFDEWMPGFNATYRIVSENFGFSDGRLFMDLSYKKVNADAKPSETPKPEVKPEPKPSETPKPEVKPETKPSETPKPEVKPAPAPKDEEQQEPLKFRITYYDNEAGKILGQMTGIINPGETINIYKNIDGYEITFKEDWMPNYVLTWDIVNEYFYRSVDGYDDLYLNYKKLEPAPTPNPAPTPTPKPEVTPEPKPSETPKPEVKPEPKPSETPKPEVKPEPAPKDEEKQEPLKYRIDYLDADTGEKMFREHGVLNPGETINIHKNIDGYEVVSKYSWMPGFNVDYRIMDTYFGSSDGYLYMFLRYKKVNADAKPSDTPKPEVKPETKPSETSKPEVKPEPNPSETPKPEVKPEPKPSETPKPAPTPTPTPEPEVKPETKPSETPKPEVNPAPKTSETPKPEVKPAPKPSDTPKPEVKPEPKPSETPKPEVKPEPKPSETPKPEVKPETKPSETPKPEVKPEPKPSDTSKPEVKPEIKPQTNSNTAPTAPVKPVGQTSNSKADKPTSKKETPALPNTGEQSSSLSLFGLLLASIGLAGLTYKGRH